MEEYVKSVSGSSHLKRIAVSLFKYLDKTNKGKITFEQMLERVIPAARDEDIARMIAWVDEEEDIINRGIVNYKLPRFAKVKEKHAKNLNFT